MGGRIGLRSSGAGWPQALAFATLAGLPPEIRTTLVAVDPDVLAWLGERRPGAATVHVPGVRDRTDLAGMRRHRRLFRELRPDLVQFNLSSASSCQWAILAAATIPRLRIVALEHSPMGSWSRLSSALKRLTARRLAAHVAVGERAISHMGHIKRRFWRGISQRDVGHQGSAVLATGLYKHTMNPDPTGRGLAHSTPPNASITSMTVSRSLSPRPDRFTRRVWSGLIRGARFRASATACADSRAGMIPSNRQSRPNAASASSSVA